MEAINPNREEMTSHPAPFKKRNETGSAQGWEAGDPTGVAAASLAGGGDDLTLMKLNAGGLHRAHSNSLGFSGAFGGTAVALATRASRLERPAAGS